jgi:hypothetical protein
MLVDLGSLDVGFLSYIEIPLLKSHTLSLLWNIAIREVGD